METRIKNLDVATNIINSFENPKQNDGKIRFREVESSSTEQDTLARVEYERKVRNVGNLAFKLEEAYADSMLSARHLQESISNATGRKIKDFEDAYTASLQETSISSSEIESYKKRYATPMMDAVGAIVKRGNTYEEIQKYVMAKHGIERNMHFAWRKNAKLCLFRKRHSFFS